MATKTYHGNCHCGAYRFHLDLPELESGLTCNCSICEKKGYVWAFTKEPDVVVDRDDGKLVEYGFNEHKLVHKVSFAESNQSHFSFVQSVEPQFMPIGLVVTIGA
jgi:hypothetical protein